jgi:hypothetical protein
MSLLFTSVKDIFSVYLQYVNMKTNEEKRITEDAHFIFLTLFLVQIMDLLIMQFCPVCQFSVLIWYLKIEETPYSLKLKIKN